MSRASATASLIGPGPVSVPDPAVPVDSLPQAAFDDLYSAVYEILDDAKTSHGLVKLYKGSHAAAQPHPAAPDFGRFFLAERRGLLGYACAAANPHHPPALSDLEVFDREHHPRIGTRSAFNLLAPGLRRHGESEQDLLAYVASRVHHLGAYRGASSGYDEEARAFAAAHFRAVGLSARPEEVLMFCGGAKGAFLAFCAALMLRRDHDDLHREGGRMLAPAGYYQSLRLIPPVFGGSINVVGELTGESVRDWLSRTDGLARRCVYVPLVNNADGRVLTKPIAHAIAREILAHNVTHPDAPVFVLADDVYVGSYLTPGCIGTPIASVTGAQVGEPVWGRISDWALTVVTASKTFALPTARVAFATTTNARLRRAVAHYRTVFSHGRVPQVTELAAIAAICLTPQEWIDRWNATYRARLAELAARIDTINASVGFEAIPCRSPARRLVRALAHLSAPVAWSGQQRGRVCCLDALRRERLRQRDRPAARRAVRPPNLREGLLAAQHPRRRGGRTLQVHRPPEGRCRSPDRSARSANHRASAQARKGSG